MNNVGDIGDFGEIMLVILETLVKIDLGNKKKLGCNEFPIFPNSCDQFEVVQLLRFNATLPIMTMLCFLCRRIFLSSLIWLKQCALVTPLFAFRNKKSSSHLAGFNWNLSQASVTVENMLGPSDSRSS